MPWLDSFRSLRRGCRMLACLATGLGLVLAAPGVLAQCQTNQVCWPPSGCAYPAPGPIFYPASPGPHGIRNGFLHDPNACTPLPTQGGTSVDSFFDIFVEIDLSSNGGSSWVHHGLTPQPGGVHIQYEQIQPPAPPGTIIFDTELVALTLTGSGFIVRESPTLASTGRITQTDLGGGQFRIDSFFDVFTELSLDGGQTWYPSDQTLHVTSIQNDPTPNPTSTWGTLKIRYR